MFQCKRRVTSLQSLWAHDFSSFVTRLQGNSSQRQTPKPPLGWSALALLSILLAGGGAGCAAAVHRPPPSIEPSLPQASSPPTQVGVASWYGPGFHGRQTASGERFDAQDLTAAHRSLPLGSHVKVTNLANGKSVRVRINDRGPYVRGRAIDLSRGAARKLGLEKRGVGRVRITADPPRRTSVRSATRRTASARSRRRRSPPTATRPPLGNVLSDLWPF